MKTLYIECNMGAAGDMLTAALLELLPEPDKFVERLNALEIPGVKIEKELTQKCGIYGTHIRVGVNGDEENEHMHHHEHHEHHEHSHEHHHHSSLHDVEHIIGHLNISEKIKNDAKAVYSLIAEAESKAHNCEIDQIHFHEVGTMDAVADVVSVCMLIDELGVENIIASPINVGSGQVRCAHGILPVPAPATAYILRDVPIYNNGIKSELCTPTGAALLKYFVKEFKPMPVMKVEKVGYGFGTKDFEEANCVRAFLGESEGKTDKIIELSCNVDDMTGERIGFAADRIFEAGAVEVFTTPIGMKKNRPGIILTAFCFEDKKEGVLKAVFKYTSTIGIRESLMSRYVLDRKEDTIETKYGRIRVKKSEGYGVSKVKAEFEDLAKAASENNIDVSEILPDGLK
ncbi:MAG: nickel pincer cofactor biosynthesis protein LarC [Clostridiales bacterium]|nr:nickel pincer cofactor biosynthesis protein LarC [Clostridiales bacterium]